MLHVARIITALLLACLINPAIAYNPNYQAPFEVEGSTTITLQQAWAMHADGVVFVDVRNPRLFRRKHIPGSYHLDLKNGFEKAALEKLVKKDQPVVIYSSGVNCARGYRAVALAVSWGFANVKYFRGGIVEWRDAGYPFTYPGPKK
jgi:rhodanese-related sulfurtransferase